MVLGSSRLPWSMLGHFWIRGWRGVGTQMLTAACVRRQVPEFRVQVWVLAWILTMSLANFETWGTLPTILTGLWSCRLQ